jgi:protein SCO1/2
LAWGAVAGVLLAAAFLYVGGPQGLALRLAGAATYGKPFVLTSHDGRPFSTETLQGRPYALFFGFTNCPDVCPTTLLEISNHLAALGPDADRLTVLFVTVDPERDTPEHLKAYLASFDARIVGLTGNAAEIASVAHAYHAFYEKVPTSSGYTLNHTATVYLIGPDGGLVGTLNHQEAEGVQRAKLKQLLAR